MQVNIKTSESEFHNIIEGQYGLQTRNGAVVELSIKDVGVSTPRTATGTQTRFVYGFSIDSANSGDTYHYLFSVDSSNVLYASLYDAQFICRGFNSVGSLTADFEPFSVAINYNQIIVNSKSMPFPLWGFVGGTLTKAIKVESINPDTPALTLFPGRVCSFADRFAWAYANQVIFNDPGTEPRTICGNNAIAFGGTVLDLFQAGEGGNLIVVCSDATYSIPPDGLNGYQFQGVISRMPGFQGSKSNNAATARGTTVGLIKDGIVDIASMKKRDINSYRARRYWSDSVGPGAAGDYRIGSIIATDDSFIINLNGKSCIIDLDSGMATWYYIYPLYRSFYANNGGLTFGFIGALRDSDGKNLFISPDSVVEFNGNMDYIDTPTSATPTPPSNSNIYGGVCFNVPTDPEQSPVVREITTSADRGGFIQLSYIRGSAGQAATPNPQKAIVINTNKWDDGFSFVEREMRSRRMQRAVRTDSPDIELTFTGGNVRISEQIDIETRGIGKTRPSN